MLDAVRFEELGLPAAAILTEPFRATGLVMAELQGFAGYPFATVPHPVASLSAEQVMVLADEVTPAVERLLVAAVAGAPPEASVAGATNAPPQASVDEESDALAQASVDGVGAGRLSLDDVVEALAEGLRADRADLTAERSGRRITFRLHIPDEACAECIVPSSMLVPILQRRVDAELGPGLMVVLDDPRDLGT